MDRPGNKNRDFSAGVIMKAADLRHIYLTGFMGAGKSTVGAALAAMLKRPCLEMDEQLSRQFKMPVAEIFARHGEEAFRAAENALLRKIAASCAPCIISTGGGTVISEENRLLMDKSGLRVFLDASVPALHKRMRKREVRARPLWQNQAQAEELRQRRYPLYNSAPLRMDGDRPAAILARDIAGRLLPVMQAELEALGRRCRLQTAWPDSAESLVKAVSGHKAVMLLDRALKNDAAHWQQQGFNVQIMRRKGEALKTFAQARAILKLLQEEKLARDDFLIVRGGGSLSDVGGFCAGIYKRGLNLILLATTLLAGVDAAIGGKTAINFARHKNQIGHFYLPRQVIIDVASFLSLKAAQISDGVVEAYKTGLVADPELAGFIEENLPVILRGDIPALAWIAGRSMQAKVSVVAQDFREERGLRDLLNFGHTFGHAVESLSDYKISHGRAVAAGMAAAVRISRRKTALPAPEAARILRTIRRICKLPPLPPSHLAGAVMAQDKKIRSGSPGFIVLARTGKARLVRDLSMEEIIAAAYEDIL
jgi:3-dehydroquinate synthetase/shikimate kinase